MCTKYLSLLCSKIKNDYKKILSFLACKKVIKLWRVARTYTKYKYTRLNKIQNSCNSKTRLGAVTNTCELFTEMKYEENICVLHNNHLFM